MLHIYHLHSFCKICPSRVFSLTPSLNNIKMPFEVHSNHHSLLTRFISQPTFGGKNTDPIFDFHLHCVTHFHLYYTLCMLISHAYPVSLPVHTLIENSKPWSSASTLLPFHLLSTALVVVAVNLGPDPSSMNLFPDSNPTLTFYLGSGPALGVDQFSDQFVTSSGWFVFHCSPSMHPFCWLSYRWSWTASHTHFMMCWFVHITTFGIESLLIEIS